MADFRLPRLPLNTPIIILKDASGKVIGQGFAAPVLQRWWQTVCEAIEGQFGSLSAAQAALAAAATATAAADTANKAAATAQSSATTANSAASAAQASTDANQKLNDLINSYIAGTAAVLSATDAGASATITIASHTRVYGNGTSVSVTGGSLTGLAYSTSYFVYYDQTSRAGGSVTYHTATTIAGAQASTAQPDGHYVGAVATPAAAGSPTAGTPAVGPGYIPPAGFNYQ